jgi:glycosyltransferase involved in cell wall biosynthesis
LRVLIIVPAYNEQEALGGLLAEIRALELEHVETLVVDDGSSDRTFEVAHGAGARVLKLCGNLGIGGAVQSGIRLAHREGFDCAVQVDGDGQHPPSELPRLLEAAKDADIVVGSRYHDTKSFRSTMMRRAGSWFLRTILRVIAGVRVSDPTSGYRLYNKRALALYDDTYPYDYPEPESLAIARISGLRISEVPVTMRERQGGSSSIGSFGAAYYMLKVTIAIVLTRIRVRRRKEPSQ